MMTLPTLCFPRGDEGRSRPPQDLTFSVARRCTVEGSKPGGARLIARTCFEAKTYVPGRVADTRRLGCVTLTNQNVFHWID
jgi:hypothetical protein